MSSRWLRRACPRWLFFTVAMVNALPGSAAPASTTPAPIELHVSILSPGKPVDAAYVALLPPWRPWSQPLAETIARNGQTTFRVSPGVYRVIAATADGNFLKDRSYFFAESRDVSVTLPPAVTFNGTVRDSDGHSVPHATVSAVDARVDAPLGQLSEMARAFIGNQWQTTTAADGTWSLALPAGEKSALSAEAAGYATAWHEHDSASNVAFTLKRGAQLVLHVDRPDPHMVVTLVAAEAPIVTTIPAGWQSQYWARVARAPSLTWANLPAGDYSIYAQPVDPKTFTAASLLTTVTLAADAKREVSVALPSMTNDKISSSALYLNGSTGDELDGLKVTDASGAPVRHAFEETSGGVLLHIAAPAERGPFVGTTANDLVGSATDATPMDAHTMEGVVVDLARGGMQIRSSDGSVAIPRAGVLAFHDCKGSAGIDVPVSVAKDGTIRFDAPANCAGLVARFTPFGPLTLARSLPTAQTTWLGEFTLFQSGKAAIHVTDDEGHAIADATVDVRAKSTAAYADERPLAHGATGPDGWVYIGDLPAHRMLAMSATTPDGTSATVERRVLPGAETTIDPLRIDRPATLVVRAELDASFRERFPQSAIRLLVLDPDGDAGSHDQRREPFSASGPVTFHGLHSGDWRITALISTGKNVQPVVGKSIHLDPAETKHLDVVLEPYVFTGRVTLNGKPIRGNLDIRGVQLTDTVPSVPTDANGEFQVILPRLDRYLVDMRTFEPARYLWVGALSFENPAQPVNVVLPAGSIHVDVRRGDSPAAGAIVTASQLADTNLGMEKQDTVEVATDERGDADIANLAAGMWTVTATDAEHGLAAASEVRVGASSAEVHLRLSDTRSLRGTLRDVTGVPVAGAIVTCVSPGAIASMSSATTADDGTFELEASTSAGESLCSVASSSGAQAYRLRAGQNADLSLPADSAELIVSHVPNVNRLMTFWLLSTDGRLLNATRYLRGDARSAALVIPQVAADTWKVMRVASLQDWVTLTSGLLEPIAEVTLHAGERKQIELRGGDTEPKREKENSR
ncbi:MAG: carboxypeptidase regulatory-like domain-containing protein [Acidobacteria bacterium]|nr:carboxypeptidase regulatory-like domain-containing protein [Acidobacteriota bacterium]MBV9474467.1 carboxypeptidase regulatory-like domain-containing protein [Acidobacteriota bacterium]